MPSNYPTYEDSLRNNIIDAAIVCIDEKGVDKTRIGDIANELGVARQTIYNYFKSKNELFDAMFSREAVSLADQIALHIEQYDDLADKFTQAFMFAVQEIPKHTVLSHVIVTGNQFLSEMGISRATMQAFGELSLQTVFAQHPFLKAQSEEISELLSRNIVSVLSLPDQNPRTADALEQFFRRRILPGVGLDQGE